MSLAKIIRVDAVATLYFHNGDVLTVHNSNWGSFMFPVTKLRSVPSHAGGVRLERGQEAAVRDFVETFQRSCSRPPELLMDCHNLAQSDRDGQLKHYTFQIFAAEVESRQVGDGIIAEWTRLPDLLHPTSKPISPTAPVLAQAISEAALSRSGSFPPKLSGPAARKSVASTAIISRKHDGHKQWLLQWNQKWQRYFLVGGHQHDGETPEACLRRELEEELCLAPDTDYELSPRKHLSFEAWSTSHWQITDYQLTTLDVDLSPAAGPRCAGDPANRWLTADEIRAERCADNQLISPTALTVLSKIGDL